MRTIILALLLLSTSLHASEETKQQKLVELLSVMEMDSMVDAMYSQMEVMLQNMSTEMGVQPSEQAIYDEHYSKMMAIISEEISWEKMKPGAMAMYSNNFTEAEIADMLDFYKTTTGKAILRKMPAVMQESMQLGQTLAQNAIPKIQVVAKQLADDLKASRDLEK